MKLRKRVIESGNSFALRITRDEADRLGVGKGDEVDLDVVRATPGLRLDAGTFFRDGRGSVRHDEEVGSAVAQGG